MGTIPNKKEATFGDGTNNYLNINTVDKRVEIGNGATLAFFSDEFTTLGGQIVNGDPTPAVSATSPALATSGTITTSGVGIARVTPGSAVSAVVLGSGTVNGQEVLVVNEAAASNTITFAASGSSFVADGISDVIPGLSAKLYVWDNAITAWVAATPQLTNGTNFTLQSATAAALATSGTVTTNGVGLARVNPGSAVTACVLGSGTIPGQQVTVVNEAVANFTVQFAASGSSFVADGINNIIPGLQMRTFVWDGAQSLWYAEPLTTNGTIDLLQSATSPAIASSGTITTNGVGVARVTPAAAVTSCVLGSGTIPGQVIVVINEATVGGSSVTFAASGSSFVADGATTAISGLRSAIYTWDSVTSLWYKAY